jgi:hypothetical protein
MIATKKHGILTKQRDENKWKLIHIHYFWIEDQHQFWKMPSAEIDKIVSFFMIYMYINAFFPNASM